MEAIKCVQDLFPFNLLKKLVIFCSYELSFTQDIFYQHMDVQDPACLLLSKFKMRANF